MKKKTMNKLPSERVGGETQKIHTAVYITHELRARLGDYLNVKYPGQMNMRNQVMTEAIERFLKAEGF